MTDERKTLDEKISEAFDIEPSPKENLPIEIEPENLPIEVTSADSDFEETRNTLKTLEDSGLEAIEHLLKLAKEAETPRSFEVIAELIKTTSQVSKDKLEIHETKKRINSEKEQNNSGGMNIENANIVVSTTKDLLKKIKDE